jgi:hypothetical protein
MPEIRFKTKPETIYNLDDSPAYTELKVPAITARHCDMPAFRTHPRFGGYANSDLFPALLKRELGKLGIPVGGYLRLDELPDQVSVDTSKFLATVTITLA